MATPRIRPTFTIEVDLDPTGVMDRLRLRLPHSSRCTGMSVGRHAELFVPKEKRRVWSPWLSVTAHQGDLGTVVRGRFSPHPSIWTLYLFLAFGMAFALLVGLVWGYAQWATETTPWALATAPLVVVAAGALYGISLFGQRLSISQMEELQEALDELIHSR